MWNKKGASPPFAPLAGRTMGLTGAINFTPSDGCDDIGRALPAHSGCPFSRAEIFYWVCREFFVKGGRTALPRQGIPAVEQ